MYQKNDKVLIVDPVNYSWNPKVNKNDVYGIVVETYKDNPFSVGLVFYNYFTNNPVEAISDGRGTLVWPYPVDSLVPYEEESTFKLAIRYIRYNIKRIIYS